MEIKINLKEMKHLKEESHYNYNVYSYGNVGLKLLQTCDEEFDTYDYYLMEGVYKIFLGSASHDEEYIHFMYMYT